MRRDFDLDLIKGIHIQFTEIILAPDIISCLMFQLKWIVSEDDVPQQLLPMPNALPVNPDAHLEPDRVATTTSNIATMPFQSLLRGNLEWAPPRPQIIFSSHPFVKRKVIFHLLFY